MQKIVCLSLTQPWATLMAVGEKRIETRSWFTTYRGLVAIHASKGYPPYAREYANDCFSELLCDAGYDWLSNPKSTVGYGGKLMPFGAIIAVGQLVDCRRTKLVYEVIGAQEKELGDYSDGRFAWMFEKVRALSEPIPAKGSLGLWEPEPAIVEQLLSFYQVAA